MGGLLERAKQAGAAWETVYTQRKSQEAFLLIAAFPIFLSFLSFCATTWLRNEQLNVENFSQKGKMKILFIFIWKIPDGSRREVSSLMPARHIVFYLHLSECIRQLKGKLFTALKATSVSWMKLKVFLHVKRFKFEKKNVFIHDTDFLLILFRNQDRSPKNI